MKAFCVLLMTLSLLLVASVSQASEVSIYPSLTQETVKVGDEVPVRINIDRVSDLKGIDILVS